MNMLACCLKGLRDMELEGRGMANLQVKGIDDDLYRALKARARRDNRSVSQEVVMLIEEFLARGGENRRRPAATLLDLAGSWTDTRSARRIVRDARTDRKRRREIERL
jgi:plasmid stability protein